MTPKQLREQRAKLVAEARTLVELGEREQRALSAEEQERWDKLDAEITRLTQAIERLERLAAADDAGGDGGDGGDGRGQRLPGRDDSDGRRERRAAVTAEQRSLAVQAWMRAQQGLPLRREHRRASQVCGVHPQQRTLTLRMVPTHEYRAFRAAQQQRAMGVSVGDAGGFAVGSQLVTNLEIAMLEFGGLRAHADVIRTERGERMEWPQTNDTSNEGAIIGENTATDERDVPMGQMILSSYKFTSRLVRVSAEMLEDDAVGMIDALGSILGERIGRRQARAYAVGTGASEPWGLMARAPKGVETASSTALTAEEILDLQHSVDPAYRPRGAYLVHDQVLRLIRKLKDSQGRYLWQESMRDGEPDRLWGRPVYIDQAIDSELTAGKKVMAFGDFSKYKIRDVGVIRLRRMVERYGEFDQEGFVAWARSDANLLDAGTGPVKHLLMKP